MKTARKILEKAIRQLATYKEPNVDDAEELIDKILTSAKLGSIKRNMLTYIHIGEKSVEIRTVYYVKGCECNADFEFPTHIIDATDPIFAATKWGLERNLENRKYDLKCAEYAVKSCVVESQKAQEELDKFLSSIN